MKTITIDQPINLRIVKFELDFSSLYLDEEKPQKKNKKIKIPKAHSLKKERHIPPPPPIKSVEQKLEVKDLIDQLLNDIYANQRDWCSSSVIECSQGSTAAASFTSSQSNYGEQTDAIERSYLESLDIQQLSDQLIEWKGSLQITGERLAKYLRTRDRLYRQQKKLCAAFTVLLHHITGDTSARFGVTPGNEGPGEGGFAEWLHAMRLVARLPAGVPQHFRRKLWLTLADRHLTARGIDWPVAERACFRGTAQPDDTELSAQILKDLHRTGCSLFCGVEGRENQAMLRRVLLAYARWNKDVGYCQGFNMLAAIILEVMDKSESDSLKVMIYLVEAVLPEGYFADDLRGLSADMAAFRDLLRLRLPRLAQHMDHLQRISDGGGVEPPLPDVFTMQWFLTLYATWLPRDSLLRIWDLILLDGNEILLLTALAIWDMLQDRILSARSADEFYSCMGGGVGAVWEAGETLVVRVVAFNSAPELPRLRSLHRYKVSPPAPPNAPPASHPPLQSAVQSMTKRGLRLFYSEDEGDSSDDGNKMALATVMPRREDRAGDRLSLDIGALKRQYARLRERQRQAHVILAAACARHAAVGVPTSPTSLTVNNLLLGKSAIVSSRGRRLGPPPGAIPPSRQTTSLPEITCQRQSKAANDTISWQDEKSRKSQNRRNSVKWKDIKKEKNVEIGRKTSIDLEEAGDGVIVSELEANAMIASMRSRSSSETSSYSSRSESSTDTSLCDENEKASDSEQDFPFDDKGNNGLNPRIKKQSAKQNSPMYKNIKSSPPINKEPSFSCTSSPEKNLSTTEMKVKNISEYLDSAAGEPLRVYIDGFELKLKEPHDISNKKKGLTTTYPLKCMRHPRLLYDKKYSFQKPEYDERKSHKKTNVSKSTTLTDYSPINSSSCHCVVNFDSQCKELPHKLCSTAKLQKNSRPPDIIDSFAMNPNFVPDIDLSEGAIPYAESPSRSPGSDSLIISEDEPPIPLKIDKYFEHSPEFFGARLSDPNNSDIPSRRPTKRNSRLPKKPDSLTLQSNNNERNLKTEVERASSLPQSHSFICQKSVSPGINEEGNLEIQMNNIKYNNSKNISESSNKTNVEELLADTDTIASKEYMLRSGRKNSERALQIIQENSQILSRILTKQNISAVNSNSLQDSISKNVDKKFKSSLPSPKITETKLLSSPLLKESTSDSLIGCLKRIPREVTTDKTDILRARPISIDDPFSLDTRNVATGSDEFSFKSIKTPSIEGLGNKTDLYGWENKGFYAKCDYKSSSSRTEHVDSDYKNTDSEISISSSLQHKNRRPISDDWSKYSFSSDSKISVTLPSSESKDVSTYERRFTSDDYNCSLTNSNKYNDSLLIKVSDECSKTMDQTPKVCENLVKTENSSYSDFSQRVTSSISFTCDPSLDDDSPMGAKSNSSDTLCQITSLDQVSTPISPKVFPNKDTPTLSRDSMEISDKAKIENDDTCSAITSLLDTDTLSSLSYPRSPSTGSYHPFPTRPPIRLPKDIGVRLGMYPKESINSPQK
ncbi:uncharacterized protein LOC126768770 isoform X1 [Nymphalis io]|uniref:uncharacterized protein LOC126768770 isoform X1 n=1 Tax=Inachis io TaxID=171585 RepID=UPI002166D577|nr:uncharacterized protein LOC126768770 isoform X1 [Nymphalis io]